MAQAPYTMSTDGVEIPRQRLVVVDLATGIVTLAVDDTVDGVTTDDSTEAGYVSVYPVNQNTKALFVKLGGAVTKGDKIGSDANGLAIVTVGTAVAYARQTGVAGDTIEIWNF